MSASLLACLGVLEGDALSVYSFGNIPMRAEEKLITM